MIHPFIYDKKRFPAELFPMDVLVSVNDMDVRSESGMILPVIWDNDSRFGRDVYVLDGNETDVYSPTDSNEQPIGYKYVLTVNEPGTQRLYFETILSHETNAHIDVTIEAEHLLYTHLYRLPIVLYHVSFQCKALYHNR